MRSSKRDAAGVFGRSRGHAASSSTYGSRTVTHWHDQGTPEEPHPFQFLTAALVQLGTVPIGLTNAGHRRLTVKLSCQDGGGMPTPDDLEREHTLNPAVLH